MPTKTWEQDHAQIKIWLPKEIARRFDEACSAAGKTKADVLREAVEIMLANGAKP